MALKICRFTREIKLQALREVNLVLHQHQRTNGAPFFSVSPAP